jgi:ABC-type lipoprotein release transport system permease subunit
MASLLFGVKPTDVLTFTTVAIALMFVAIAASYIPARRAMRTDPLAALRHE